jgi:hypothetical protein
LFTNEREELEGPTEVDIPNEITLTQPVEAYIVTARNGKFDINTVFSWNLEKVEDTTKKDKTKRTLIQIPHKMPPGLNLRVKANTLHKKATGKQLAQLAYGDARFYLAMRPEAILAEVSEGVARVMKGRDLSDDWRVEGNSRECVDFEYCYPVVPKEIIPDVEVYLKQSKLTVKSNES